MLTGLPQRKNLVGLTRFIPTNVILDCVIFRLGEFMVVLVAWDNDYVNGVDYATRAVQISVNRFTGIFIAERVIEISV